MRTNFRKSISRFFGLLAVGAVAITAVSCSNGGNGNKTNGVSVLDFDKAFANIEDIKLSEVAKSIRYIPVETKSGALISSVTKNIDVYVMDGVGFFFRCHNSEPTGVHHFSPDGKYISSIGTKGRAKGEFLFNTYVVPMPDRKEIAIGGPQDMVVYNLDNEYIWDIKYANIDTLKKFNANFWGLFYFGDGTFGKLMGAKTGIGETDPNLFMMTYTKESECKELYPMLREGTFEYSIGNGPTAGVKQSSVAIGRFFTADNENFYLRNTNDTLFMFGEKFKLEPVFKMEYGKIGVANKTDDYENKITLCANDFGGLKKLGNNFLIPFTANAMDYPEGMPYFSSKNEGSIIFDSESGKTRIFSYNPTVDMAGFVNDLDNGLPFYPSLIQNGKMYQCIDAIQLLEKVEYVDSKALKEIVATMGEESNPVIIEVTLK